jgi:FkbM family methyltransferase
LIKKHRSRDIFLNVAISENDNQLMNYYLFDENASSNTLDKTFAHCISKSQNIPIKQVLQVKTSKLDTIVKLFEKDIFLLNIDVEGMDEIILKNYSWKIRPTFIWIEDWNHETKQQNVQIVEFLNNLNYKPIANVYLTTLYSDINS